MLHHVSFAVIDIAHSAAFYDAVLAVLGYVRVWADNGAPGLSTEHAPGCYAAFVLDSGGRRIEAVVIGPA